MAHCSKVDENFENKPAENEIEEDIPQYLQSQLSKAEDIEMHIKDIEEE